MSTQTLTFDKTTRGPLLKMLVDTALLGYLQGLAVRAPEAPSQEARATKPPSQEAPEHSMQWDWSKAHEKLDEAGIEEGLNLPERIDAVLRKPVNEVPDPKWEELQVELNEARYMLEEARNERNQLRCELARRRKEPTHISRVVFSAEVLAKVRAEERNRIVMTLASLDNPALERFPCQPPRLNEAWLRAHVEE